MTEFLPLLLFIALLGGILLGYPVAFTLAGTAIIFGVIGHYLDVFYLSDFAFAPNRIFGVMSNVTLMAVPLFVFMGITLEKSQLAEELLRSMENLCSRVRGGLALSVIFVGALLAAATGIVGATVVTMGALSLPTMLKRSYNKELTTGVIAASGTLGQIIPPSIVLVLLGDVMNVDVGDLFTGALIPGLLLVALYISYVLIRVALQPSLAPALPTEAQHQGSRPSVKETLQALVPTTALIVIVLGSIFSGLASPTEAAGCGALGAILVAVAKRKFSWSLLRSAASETVSLTGMVFMILIGAQFFGIVFRGLDGDAWIGGLIESAALNPHAVLLFVLLLIFILGFFLDFFEICFIVLPIVTPILTGFGFDPVWLAILIAINLQTSFLTPPFGFALFYLKGVAPTEVKTSHIYKGIIPFVLIQLFGLFLVYLFPKLALWLPQNVFN